MKLACIMDAITKTWPFAYNSTHYAIESQLFIFIEETS